MDFPMGFSPKKRGPAKINDFRGPRLGENYFYIVMEEEGIVPVAKTEGTAISLHL
jgi:hypothetical protein